MVRNLSPLDTENVRQKLYRLKRFEPGALTGHLLRRLTMLGTVRSTDKYLSDGQF